MFEFHILEMTFSYIAKIPASLWNKVWFGIANFLNFVQNYLSDYTSSVSVMEYAIVVYLVLLRQYHTFLFSIRVRFACASTYQLHTSLYSCAFSFFFFSYSVFVFSLQWKCLFIFPDTLFAKVFGLFMTRIWTCRFSANNQKF